MTMSEDWFLKFNPAMNKVEGIARGLLESADPSERKTGEALLILAKGERSNFARIDGLSMRELSNKR